LKNAFGSYKNIFSDFFLGMLEAGETGGELAKVLEMSAVYLEKQDEIRRKVRSAFVYPIVVFIMCLVVVSCFLVFVIPVFSKMYGQLHVSLPGPTQFLMDVSCFFRGWWWAILFVSGGAVIGLRRLLKKPHIRKKWDGFKLNMPVFGKLNRMVVVSNFTRAWAIMLSAGVSLIEALNMASLVAHNYKVSQITEELQEAIKGGNQIAKSLKKCDIFPPMITQLVASGEEAGKLAEMLNKGTDILDKEIERTIGSLLVKLEPALTVIMGVIVGFLLISMYLPMFDYMSHLK
jgi:type IV pilus assembly protein PilC